jgi:NADH:ubiquinone oxidoreductase subunit 3 (subunit A)
MEFAPICIYLVIRFLLSLMSIGVSFLFASSSKLAYPKKLLAYECGFDPLAFFFIFLFSTLDLLFKLSWFMFKYMCALFFEGLLYLSLHQNTYCFLLFTLSLPKIEILP